MDNASRKTSENDLPEQFKLRLIFADNQFTFLEYEMGCGNQETYRLGNTCCHSCTHYAHLHRKYKQSVQENVYHSTDDIENGYQSRGAVVTTERLQIQ